jgi:hypothetical protein
MASLQGYTAEAILTLGGADAWQEDAAPDARLRIDA